LIFSPAGAVGADKIRVAERALRRSAILFVARPKIAPRKAAEHSDAPRMGAFALQGQEYLFDGVAHGIGPSPNKIVEIGIKVVTAVLNEKTV
jgi:hypothetical protein